MCSRSWHVSWHVSEHGLAFSFLKLPLLWPKFCTFIWGFGKHIFLRILTNRENLLAPQYWTSWTLELPGFDRRSQGRTRRNCAFPYPLGGLPVERGQHMSQRGHGQIFESQECQRGIELPANILFWLFSLFLLYFTEMEYEAKRLKTEGFLFLV